MSWIEWLEHHLLACPNKVFFGMECPGCGMQRSIIELMKGNFTESLKLYPALLPLLFTLGLLGFHLRFRFRNGAKMLQYSYIVSATIVLVSFIIKQIHIFNP